MSDGKSLTFCGLFDEVGRVEVPIIQRDYAQGREAARDVRTRFLGAIKDALMQPPESAHQPLDLDFIYGSVEGDDTRVFSVLDGQQRLTTLFLLHWYLSIQDGLYPAFCDRFSIGKRSRFTYETRPSSREFFNELVCLNESIQFDAEDPQAVSESIRERQWFYLSWEQDPTIHSCLAMLDAIHNEFAEVEGLYSRLVDESTPYVTFQYLNLDSFDLSDDLYIKMNARGKALSAFENFKAWLFGSISGASFEKEFERNIDQAWTDVFWRLSKKLDRNFDELFQRFFNLLAFFRACENLEGSYRFANYDIRDWIGITRGSDGYIPLRGFEDNGSFDEKTLARIRSVLSYFASYHDGPIASLFEELLIGNNAVLQAKFYSFILFVSSAPEIDNWSDEEHEQLRRWMRVTSNLINNVRVDDLTLLNTTLRGIDALSKSCGQIYEDLSEMEEADIEFASDQRAEEIIKARLILSGLHWEGLILNAENHEYLNGRVGFLLDFSLEGDNHNSELFKSYASTTDVLLSQGILGSNEFLLQRALLSIDNYLIWHDYSILSFGLPSFGSYRDRSENWFQVVEKPVFKSLLDRIDGDVEGSLRAIIESVSCGGWRQSLAQHPAAIKYCGRRLLHRDGSDIKLLTKSSLRGYHVELRTYLLYKEMERLESSGDLPETLQQFSLHQTYNSEIPGINLMTESDEVITVSYKDGEFFAYAGFDETFSPNFLPVPISILNDLVSIMDEAGIQ